MSSPPPSDDGFTSITYKKPLRAPRNRKGRPSTTRERSIEEKVVSRMPALRRSGYLRECRKLIRTALAPPGVSTATEGDEAERKGVPPCPPPVCVVCLGLGSLADSTKAQDQYILLKEVLEELEGVLNKNVKTEFYDPVFTPEDAAFLASEGHSVLSAEHPLHLPRPTLLYIPHGPRTLFDALLAANWTSAEQLGRVVVLGNRLDLYDDPTYSGSMRRSDGDGSGRRKGKGVKSEGGGDELGESAEYVVQAAKLFNIVPLPDTKEHLEAFNDLALEWVVPSRVEGREEGFWRTEEKEGGEEKVEKALEGLEKLVLE